MEFLQTSNNLGQYQDQEARLQVIRHLSKLNQIKQQELFNVKEQ